MAAYDIEEILDNVASFLQSNLNTRLGEIDTEKGDGITLKTVSNDAYFLQTLNINAVNLDPFILYGVDSEEADGVGPATGRRVTIMVVLTMIDHGDDADIVRRLFRYRRSMRELFEENYNRVDKRVKFEVKTLEPVGPFKMVNSTEDFRAVGVGLEFSFA